MLNFSIINKHFGWVEIHQNQVDVNKLNIIHDAVFGYKFYSLKRGEIEKLIKRAEQAQISKVRMHSIRFSSNWLIKGERI